MATMIRTNMLAIPCWLGGSDGHAVFREDGLGVVDGVEQLARILPAQGALDVLAAGRDYPLQGQREAFGFAGEPAEGLEGRVTFQLGHLQLGHGWFLHALSQGGESTPKSARQPATMEAPMALGTSGDMKEVASRIVA